MEKVLYLTVRNSFYLHKYVSQVRAWNDLGYECISFNLNYSITSFVKLNMALKSVNIVYLRHDIYSNFIWRILKLMLTNKKIIVEIPTPINVYFYEQSLRAKKWKAIINSLIIKANLSNIVKSADIIIEMAEERDLTVLNQKEKIFLWQNGMNNPESYGFSILSIEEQKKQIIKFQNKFEFNLLVVANLADYHGVDRVVKGIYEYYKTSISQRYLVKLHIVSGDSEALIIIKKLVTELNLSDYVILHGHKNLMELHSLFEMANLAIGSIGFHRIFLDSGAPLKAREYFLYGLPTIINYFDYDLSPTEFVTNCDRNDNPVNINEVISFYHGLILKYNDNLGYKIHNFAITNLLWAHKVKSLVDFCKMKQVI